MGGGGQLADLEHFIAYTKDTNKIYLKQPPKPQTKTMKFVFGENEINAFNQVKEMGVPFTSWVLIGRKDLFKSIKYQGKELLTEPTVDPIDWTIEGETVPSYLKQELLFEYYLTNQETMDWNSDYVLTIQDVLGKGFPEVGDEILLEVEFKDGLTDLSAMHAALSLGLVEISSNLFEDCTEVTNFEYAFDNSILYGLGITYENPLKSSCPVDKDGTPLYERSNGKEGYATVTDSRCCFYGCENMKDYNSISCEFGGKYFDENKSNVVFICDAPTEILERLENGDEKVIELKEGKNIVYGLPYGFINNSSYSKIGTTAYHIGMIDSTCYDTSKITNFEGIFENSYGHKILNINTSNGQNFSNMFLNSSFDTIKNFDTSNVTNMSGMFNSCRSLTSLNLSNFDTSKVTDMNKMFSGCSGLTSLNLSNFNTSAVSNMYGMFNNCSSLTSLDLSNFDTSNVTSMGHIFSNCNNLTSLNLSNFDTSNVIKLYDNIGYMFFGCDSLTYIKCKQSFKDWCLTNQNTINLPESMREGGNGTWDIVD